MNNAGRNSYADPVGMTEEQCDEFMSVDLKSAWMCARQVLPAMIAARAGTILNIASVHADHTFPGYFPYAAAKSGLVGLTRSLALEVGPNQIRVNALSPGWTETPLVADYFARNSPETRQKVLDIHPMGFIATPMDVANCAAFLLSDEARFVTGANWRVDGGLGARLQDRPGCRRPERVLSCSSTHANEFGASRRRGFKSFGSKRSQNSTTL